MPELPFDVEARAEELCTKWSHRHRDAYCRESISQAQFEARLRSQIPNLTPLPDGGLVKLRDLIELLVSLLVDGDPELAVAKDYLEKLKRVR